MRTILITCLSILFWGSGCKVYTYPPTEQITQETLGKFLNAGDRIKVHTNSNDDYRLKLIGLEETFLLGKGARGTIKIPYKLIDNIKEADEQKISSATSIAMVVLLSGFVFVMSRSTQ